MEVKTQNINLRPEDHELLLQLVQKHLPKATIWAFGSRITPQTRPSSDLDLAAFIAKEDEARFYDLKEACEESNLNIRIDLHDWRYLPEPFRQQIRQQHIVFYQPKQSS